MDASRGAVSELAVVAACCTWASVWADAVEACIIAQASVGMLFERARAVSWVAGGDGARLWSRGLVVSAGVFGCTERAGRTFLGGIGGGRPQDVRTGL